MSAAILILVHALGLTSPARLAPCGGENKEAVRVTVVAVLATTANAAIDPKLAELAREVKKRNPNLTGFSVAGTNAKSITVGESVEFALVDKAVLTVKAERPKDSDGRISLTIKPPELGEIKYACTCDKFFPVVTPYKTAKGEWLIVAVMAKSCLGKKP